MTTFGVARRRDHRGHFVRVDCPECGNGRLQNEGNGYWRCDGLADPGHPNKPLEACSFTHMDGKLYTAPSVAVLLIND